MNLTAHALKLSLLISMPTVATTTAGDQARTLHFRGGIDVAFTFAHGPAVTADAKFESVALVEVNYGSRDGQRVRDVDFDAVMDMGRDQHTLSSVRSPVTTPLAGGRAWQIRNIFFTMDRNWAGKLTLKFDDGTAETQLFPIVVHSN